MLVVRVELWSAVDGSKQELARMVIDNTGGTPQLGNYRVRTLRGQSLSALDRAMIPPLSVTREGAVHAHPRLREHVWNLVAKALQAMRYGSSNQ